MKTPPKVSKKMQRSHKQSVVPSESEKTRTVNYEKYMPAFICLLAFIIYSNTLFLDYALDDRMVITENQFVLKGVKGLKDIFTTDSFVGFFGKEKNLLEGGRYRPLSIATFALENAFFGKSPFFSHLFNVLIYMATCLLVFSVLKMIIPIKKGNAQLVYIPFIAAVLFTVHPLHTEAVANIKGRDELMSFLFAMLTLYLVLKYVRNSQLYLIICAFLSFLAGMLSKENAITFLAVVPLTLYFFTGAKAMKYIAGIGAMLFAVIVFFILRYHALGFLFSNHFISGELLNNPFLFATTLQKYATIIMTWGIYLRLLLIPHPLTHDYYPKQVPLVDFADIRVLLSVLAVLFLIIYAVVKFRKNEIISFSILFVITTFSISSNLFINIGTFMNERFMYAPSLGFTLAVAYLFSQIYETSEVKKKGWSKALMIVITIVAVLYAGKSFARNFAWKDDFTLFTTDVKTSSESAKCNVSAGGQTMERMDSVKEDNIRNKMLVEALRYLEKGVGIHPYYVQGWVLFGNAHIRNNDFSAAIGCYRNALKIAPGAPDALHNLLFTAQRAAEKDSLDESIEAYKILLSQDKNNETYLLGLSDNYIRKKMSDSSLLIVNQLLSKPEPSFEAFSKAGEIWGRYLNRPDISLGYLLKAREINPDDLSVNENLGIVYGMKGDFPNSLKYFHECLKKEPDNPRILNNIGLTYMMMGQKLKADEYYRKARQIKDQ